MGSGGVGTYGRRGRHRYAQVRGSGAGRPRSEDRDGSRPRHRCSTRRQVGQHLARLTRRREREVWVRTELVGDERVRDAVRAKPLVRRLRLARRQRGDKVAVLVVGHDARVFAHREAHDVRVVVLAPRRREQHLLALQRMQGLDVVRQPRARHGDTHLLHPPQRARRLHVHHVVGQHSRDLVAARLKVLDHAHQPLRRKLLAAAEAHAHVGRVDDDQRLRLPALRSSWHRRRRGAAGAATSLGCRLRALARLVRLQREQAGRQLHRVHRAVRLAALPPASVAAVTLALLVASRRGGRRDRDAAQHAAARGQIRPLLRGGGRQRVVVVAGGDARLQARAAEQAHGGVVAHRRTTDLARRFRRLAALRRSGVHRRGVGRRGIHATEAVPEQSD
mmetsp:Transcript_20011/g.70770  ORF Transcript_20011/g.70770 Transcript_20011/m.70770 type:complete len:391 (+) Transcript_20011:280-1452(+)